MGDSNVSPAMHVALQGMDRPLLPSFLGSYAEESVL